MKGPNNLFMTIGSKHLKNYVTKMSQLVFNTGI